MEMEMEVQTVANHILPPTTLLDSAIRWIVRTLEHHHPYSYSYAHSCKIIFCAAISIYLFQLLIVRTVLSRFSFNLVPRFPPYKGPYTVASLELEIPVSSLPVSRRPGSAENVSTVLFRVFYPTAHRAGAGAGVGADGTAADANARCSPLRFGQRAATATRAAGPCPASKPVYWLPEPHQREYLSGYARFLGAPTGLAELVSYIPRMLYHIALPAVSLAPLLPTEPAHRFPTIIFSHGLGGTRLAYSHLCGSIASYGPIVVAPEHRDGSAPVTFIKPGHGTGGKTSQVAARKPAAGEPGIDWSSAASATDLRVQIDYTSYPHQISEETAGGRNRQLEIRLWELSAVYSALTGLDLGTVPEATAMLHADADAAAAAATANTAAATAADTSARDALLATFKDKLDIRQPGRVIWAGHSFGSATMVQMVKSVYYAGHPPAASEPIGDPLCMPDLGPSPGPAVPLSAQITPASPLLLLDQWCLPLLSKRTRLLWKLPLPQVAGGHADRVLVVMSDEFHRWRENLRGVRRLLSPDPGRRRGVAEHRVFEQWEPQVPEEAEAASQAKEPPSFHPADDLATPAAEGPPPEPLRRPHAAKAVRLYYVKDSAHLSQSDFGLLFPRAIKEASGPEAILDLNVRAVGQWLREVGYAGQIGNDCCQGSELHVHGTQDSVFDNTLERFKPIALEEDAVVAGEGAK